MKSRGMILIAHGSRNPKWRDAFAGLASRINQGREGSPTRPAFMELSPPGLDKVVEEMVDEGYDEIQVFPLFLARGNHVNHDIPALVEECRNRYPEVIFQLLPPLGDHDVFWKVVSEIATGYMV